MGAKKLKSFEIAVAEISFLIHATEDKDRVINMISSVLIVDKDEFESENLLGHWGNQIEMIRGKLKRKFANDVASTIFASFDTYGRKKMLYSLDDYVDDKGTLHLRLDKQKICEGKIVLSDIDSIKIKFKPKLFFSRIKQDYILQYRRLLGSND
ncbi:MAG: RNA-binding domain-containing protein [Nitrososphaeraceae archaeon]